MWNLATLPTSAAARFAARGPARLAPAAIAAALTLGACGTPAALRGPMPVRNQHPTQLTVLHMDPARAVSRPAGDVQLGLDLAYTSLFLSGRGRGPDTGDFFTMDGEILRTGLKADVALGGELSLRVEVPILHTTGGFLDEFIIDWHDLFGLPDQRRSTAVRDGFTVRADHDGTTVYQMERRELALADVPFTLQWNLFPVTQRRLLGLGARVAIELPTGDDDRGFGNGGLDLALGLVGEWRGPGFGLTSHVQHTFVHTPDRAHTGGLNYRDVTSAGLAAELPINETWALLAQTEIETSTLAGLEVGEAADPQWLLWTGVRAHLGDDLWLDIALAEDLTTDVPPDFTAWISLGFQRRPGPPPD